MTAAASAPTVDGSRAVEPSGARIRCDGLVAVYPLEGSEVVALRGIDLAVEPAESVTLLGPSGSGKSTLLSLLAGLLRPTAGRISLDGRDLARLSQRQLSDVRARQVGVVLQNPGTNLLGYASPIENLLFAQRPSRRSAASKRRRAAEMLAAVCLTEAADRPALHLSGGEQQRLAVAAALANGPRLLLADEPTSQLDPDSSAAIVSLLREAADLGTTVVVVTHDPAVSAGLGRTVTIRDGRVGGEGRGGQEYVVVGREGAVQLPEDVLDLLPPGALAKVHRRDGGIFLARSGELP
ncbi:MAG: ABC transporter ATP-binding protein [Mycobacteriales bacterium]